jgi:hypothetical protein
MLKTLTAAAALLAVASAANAKVAFPTVDQICATEAITGARPART